MSELIAGMEALGYDMTGIDTLSGVAELLGLNPGATIEDVMAYFNG